MLIYEKLVDGIFLVKSDSKFRIKSNGILIKNVNGSGNVLIDCNFKVSDNKELFESLNNQVEAYFVTHMHIDHANNTHVWEDLGVKIYAPVPESDYLRDFNIFARDNGMIDMGVNDLFRMFVFQYTRFKEVKSVINFTPGKEFKFGDVLIKTIAIPGHSPGQTAFVIEDLSKERRKILFVSDIGITPSGRTWPWYGFKYCDLDDYRNSLKKMEELYLSDDFILTCGHGPIFFDKKPNIFSEIREKIDENEEKVLNIFNSKEPKGFDDIIFKEIIYKEKQIDQRIRDLYRVWEGYILLKHIHELVEKGKLVEVEGEKWILNK